MTLKEEIEIEFKEVKVNKLSIQNNDANNNYEKSNDFDNGYLLYDCNYFPDNNISINIKADAIIPGYGEFLDLNQRNQFKSNKSSPLSESHSSSSNFDKKDDKWKLANSISIPVISQKYENDMSNSSDIESTSGTVNSSENQKAIKIEFVQKNEEIKDMEIIKIKR